MSNSSEMVFREVSCVVIKVEETYGFVIWHLSSSELVFVSILNAMKNYKALGPTPNTANESLKL